MKITIEHERQTITLEDEDVVTLYQALRLCVHALAGLGYIIPKGLTDAAFNEDWSDLEEEE